MKYRDSVRVWQGRARKHWHNFDKWQDNDTIRFNVEGEQKGEVFAFTYDYKTAKLTCGWQDCATDQYGENLKGAIRPTEVLQ
jgi:major membrane immunogen (membrane-anchored lipoprotein)